MVRVEVADVAAETEAAKTKLRSFKANVEGLATSQTLFLCDKSRIAGTPSRSSSLWWVKLYDADSRFFLACLSEVFF